MGKVIDIQHLLEGQSLDFGCVLLPRALRPGARLRQIRGDRPRAARGSDRECARRGEHRSGRCPTCSGRWATGECKVRPPARCQGIPLPVGSAPSSRRSGSDERPCFLRRAYSAGRLQMRSDRDVATSDPYVDPYWSAPRCRIVPVSARFPNTNGLCRIGETRVRSPAPPPHAGNVDTSRRALDGPVRLPPIWPASDWTP